jgi:dihydrofolate reductase
MKLIAIAAIGKNREIGKDNQLIWHFPTDLKFFRSQTKGHTIVMGKNTWLSLPKKLPNRKHIVISKTLEPSEDYELFSSIEDFKKAYSQSDEEIFVIGGGMIYKSMVPYCDELILTEIDAAYDADTYFPEFDSSLYSRQVIDQVHENDTDYAFVRYTKK